MIKPVVGLNAHGAFRLDAQSARSRADELYAYYADRALLAQPFLSAIVTEGEFSLFYFNGALSHTILKLPKANRFPRAGRTRRNYPRRRNRRCVARCGDAAMRAIGAVPLYARADFVRANGSSTLNHLSRRTVAEAEQPQRSLLADGVGTHRTVTLSAHGQRSARALRACAARPRAIRK